MRTVTHIYFTSTEANAFVDGVQWVNDSAVEVQDIQDGEDEDGPFAKVICLDEDGEEDKVFDHRDRALLVDRNVGRLGIPFTEVGSVVQALGECLVDREVGTLDEIRARILAWVGTYSEGQFWDRIGGPAVDALEDELEQFDGHGRPEA